MGAEFAQAGGLASGQTVVLYACRFENRVLEFYIAATTCEGFSVPLGWEGAYGCFVSRMPFGWKHSPLFCQTALGPILWPLIPYGYLLFHYLDDFLMVGTDPVQLAAITARVVRALEEAGFLVSTKSTLDPVTKIFSLDKFVNLGVHMILSHPLAFLQMFNNPLRLTIRSRPSSRLLSKALRFSH